MADRLTKHQVAGIKKNLEQKRNRVKMKERLKARRQERHAGRHGSPRRDNQEIMELIDEFLGGFDDDGEVESDG
ncbi:MAG: hypothetical protein NUW12_07610 [Firmicutes bacterium]|jgi:hypothetical protein|nr:hypothetical protein [Bacillota bacterium]MDH7495485.1 hypothetical protein [Bacillota bacterium]